MKTSSFLLLGILVIEVRQIAWLRKRLREADARRPLAPVIPLGRPA